MRVSTNFSQEFAEDLLITFWWDALPTIASARYDRYDAGLRLCTQSRNVPIITVVTDRAYP